LFKRKSFVFIRRKFAKIDTCQGNRQFRDYIVFSEPTWGLDIVSSQFIKEEINKLKKNGAAIILISANLDEILELSDRIVVMYKGKIAGVYINNGDTAIKEKIGRSMQGLNNEK